MREKPHTDYRTAFRNIFKTSNIKMVLKFMMFNLRKITVVILLRDTMTMVVIFNGGYIITVHQSMGKSGKTSAFTFSLEFPTEPGNSISICRWVCFCFVTLPTHGLPMGICECDFSVD